MGVASDLESVFVVSEVTALPIIEMTINDIATMKDVFGLNFVYCPLFLDFTNEYTRSITRKEFCDLIYRLTATEFNPIADSRKGQQDAIKQVIAERQLEDKISEVSYSDCDDEKIKFLSGAGIIYGMDDGTFAPDDNITREQAAAILYRTAGFLGNKTIVEPNGTTFDDGKLISDWARESVSIMNSMKIMEGVSDTEFAPKGNYTVEQAIATMVRLYNCY